MPRDGYTASVPPSAPVVIIGHGRSSAADSVRSARVGALWRLRVLVASGFRESSAV
jgi:hypothetical protein